MMPRNSNERIGRARIVYTGPVPAPINKGQSIGKLKVWRGENLALEVPLKAAEDIGPGSMSPPRHGCGDRAHDRPVPRRREQAMIRLDAVPAPQFEAYDDSAVCVWLAGSCSFAVKSRNHLATKAIFLLWLYVDVSLQRFAPP